MEPFLYPMTSLSHHWDRLLCSEEARTDNRSPPQSAHQLMPGLQGLINDLPTNRMEELGLSLTSPKENPTAFVELIDVSGSRLQETAFCATEDLSVDQFTNVLDSSSAIPYISETQTDTVLAEFEPCNLSDSGSGISESGYNSDRDNRVENSFALSQTTFQLFLMNLQMRRICPWNMHKFRRMQRVKRILLLALIVFIVLILIGGAIFIYFTRKGQTEVVEEDFPVLKSTPRSVFFNPMHVLMFDKNETKIENPPVSKSILDVINKANMIGQNNLDKKHNLTISDSLRQN